MCPECGKPMIVLELEGIELDHCLECGGTWLDAEELEWLHEVAGTAPGAVRASLAETRRRTQPKRKCPRCRKKLDVVTIGKSPAVEVDRCSRGHGLWLDRGELQAIVEAFGSDMESSDVGALARKLAEFFQYDLNSSLMGD